MIKYFLNTNNDLRAFKSDPIIDDVVSNLLLSSSLPPRYATLSQLHKLIPQWYNNAKNAYKEDKPIRSRWTWKGMQWVKKKYQ